MRRHGSGEGASDARVEAPAQVPAYGHVCPQSQADDRVQQVLQPARVLGRLSRGFGVSQRVVALYAHAAVAPDRVTTRLQGPHPLEPGCYAVWRDGRLRVQRYYA